METKFIPLEPGEKKRIHKAINLRVYQLENNQEIRKKLFADLHRNVKEYFRVPSYKDIKRQDLQRAIRYIESWMPMKVY
jgi:predicted site-specific integrase-resolvase